MKARDYFEFASFNDKKSLKYQRWKRFWFAIRECWR